MKTFFIQIIFLTLVIFIALAYQTGRLSSLSFLPNAASIIQPAPEPVKKLNILIKDTKLTVEVADTPGKRSLGLGGRSALAADSGMLFVFEKAETHTFWMKGMQFPLDFIWIRDSVVIDVTKNAPNPDPGTPDNLLPKFSPSGPVDMILEVNAGFIDTNGISIGDTITND